MKYGLGKPALVVLFVLLTGSAASRGQGVPATVHYIPHDQVAAAFLKAEKIVNDPGFVVVANSRPAKVNPVEFHEKVNHVWIITDGEATFVTGGKMVNAKRISPDEMTADAIEGGETIHLSKGDVITIPAKTPHWWKDISTKTISYYTINIYSK